MKNRLTVGVIAIVATIAAACGGSPTTSSASPGAIAAPSHLVIAYQPGIGYAQLLIIQHEKWIEKDFPSTTVEWKVESSGSAIRDGMIAGQIQFGAGGVGPFLVGWSKGVAWKLLSSMNEMDLWLNAKDPSLKSLKDLKPGMKIALPAPDSIQAVALRKGAQDQLGDAHKLDSNMVAMSHPDGVQNLLTGQIAAHLTSPPFQFQEVAQGAHTIFHSYDAFGPSTFNSIFVTDQFRSQYPAFVDKFFGYVKRATDLIHSDIATAAQVVAASEKQDAKVADYKSWMTHEGLSYTMTPGGFLKYAAFMKQIGMIPKTPSSIKDIEISALQKLGGS